MRDLQKGDVIVCAFPFADGYATKVRPAVVYAGPWTIGEFSVWWVLMITSSMRQPWPGDVIIGSADIAGLPKTSLVRTLKISCIDSRNILQAIGKLDAKTLHSVQKNMGTHMKKRR